MKKTILTLAICCLITGIYAQDFKFGKITKAELEEKTYPLDSTAKAAYLYKHKNVYFEYDGTLGWSIVTEVHERIKLYSKKEEAAATKVIKIFERGGVEERISSLKAYTYNLVDGKIKKEKLSSKQVFEEASNENWTQQKFTMPNLQDGSVVEWTYKKKSPYYLYIDDIAFQHDIPIKKLEIKVVIPQYFVFKKHYKGYLFLYFKEETKNKVINYSYREKDSDFGATTTKYNERVDLTEKVFSIDENNIPAINTTEPYVTNVQNYVGGVSFELNSIQFPNSIPKYYTTTWEDVVKQIYKNSNFGGELSRTSYFKEELDAILKNASTDPQKIEAIFQFVKSKVKWNGSYGLYVENGVRDAYKKGVGNVADINFILISMLREAGFNSSPVLVSTRDNDSGFLSVPTINGFNYVVASVVFREKYYVLDATETYSVLNVLPLRAITNRGRVVDQEGNSLWLNLTPNQASLEDHKMYVTLDEDFNAEGVLRTTYTNLLALNYRNSKNHLKEDGLIKTLEDGYEIEIDEFKVSNKTTINKPIIRNFKFIDEDFVEEISGKVYISPLSFLTLTINPFKLKEREFPVDFGFPFKEKSAITMTIPDGYKVESFPEAQVFTISNDMAVYGFKVVSAGNKINVISQLEINASIITPEFYKELKEFYSQMIKKQTEKIVLVKE